jgi:WD40 repeat protein
MCIETLLRDVLRALLTYQTPLSTFTMQVYYGILTTMPKCGLLYMVDVKAEAPRLVSMQSPEWSATQVVMEGHSNWVFSVAFSPDGTRIVSGSSDKTMRIWDAQTGLQTTVLEGHSGPVYSVAFSPDGTRIVSGSLDETVRIWDAQTGLHRCVRSYRYRKKRSRVGMS